MSHRGSILATAAGILGWRPTDVTAITPEDLEPLRDSGEPIEIFILGGGKTMRFPSPAIRGMLNDICRSVDVMSTSSAITTYNILLGEGRRVAAGLIAVEHTR